MQRPLQLGALLFLEQMFIGTRVKKKVVVGLLAGALLLSGCTATETVTPTASESVPAQTATPTPTKDPEFIPGGSAEKNLPYFSWVVTQAIAGDPATDSSLVAQRVSESGFSGNLIQYTFSRTAIGLASDSSDVAVEYDGQCLIAQYGKVFPEPQFAILPVLASGGCLLGRSVQTFG